MPLTLVPEPIESYAAAHTEQPPALLHRLREETYAKMNSPQMQVVRRSLEIPMVWPTRCENWK